MIFVCYFGFGLGAASVICWKRCMERFWCVKETPAFKECINFADQKICEKSKPHGCNGWQLHLHKLKHLLYRLSVLQAPTGLWESQTHSYKHTFEQSTVWGLLLFFFYTDQRTRICISLHKGSLKWKMVLKIRLPGTFIFDNVPFCKEIVYYCACNSSRLWYKHQHNLFFYAVYRHLTSSTYISYAIA